MPASVRNWRCCALAGTAIFADVQSFAKEWVGAMFKDREERRRGKKGRDRAVESGTAGGANGAGVAEDG
jgi:hypothetical protein